MKSFSPESFKKRQQEFILLDVREPHEVEYARIDPHIHIPMAAIPIRRNELKKESQIVVICHTGVRSAQVCHYLQQQGYDVTNLEGGIDAWSRLVDPSVRRY